MLIYIHGLCSLFCLYLKYAIFTIENVKYMSKLCQNFNLFNPSNVRYAGWSHWKKSKTDQILERRKSRNPSVFQLKFPDGIFKHPTDRREQTQKMTLCSLCPFNENWAIEIQRGGFCVSCHDLSLWGYSTKWSMTPPPFFNPIPLFLKNPCYPHPARGVTPTLINNCIEFRNFFQGLSKKENIWVVINRWVNT